jgi:hypothetical protein
MHVALCARVSTLNGQNPEMQLAELREYSTRSGCGLPSTPPRRQAAYDGSEFST